MEYNFIEVSTSLINFMTNTLSAFYMDYAKDILYIDKVDGFRRRQVQTVFYQCTDALCKLWSPILSFTAEEVFWTYSNEAESVFLTEFPEAVKYDNAEAVKSQWDKLMKVRDDILKALEIARNDQMIGKALEAKVLLNVKPEFADALEGLTEHDLAQLTITSMVELTDRQENEYDTSFITIEKIEGHTCPRCWNMIYRVDEDGLCDRCHKVLKG